MAKFLFSHSFPNSSFPPHFSPSWRFSFLDGQISLSPRSIFIFPLTVKLPSSPRFLEVLYSFPYLPLSQFSRFHMPDKHKYSIQVLRVCSPKSSHGISDQVFTRTYPWRAKVSRTHRDDAFPRFERCVSTQFSLS